MATTHNARRRQHKHRTTPAHTRHNRVVGTRPDRASAPAAPEAEAEEVQVTVTTKVVKAVRAPDSDDHLAAYFRQLAEHELLTPEDERELSQGIEDTEILTWERVLSRPEAVRPLLALIEPNLDQPIKFPKLQKILDDMLKTKRARKDDKLVKKLVSAAKEAAVQLRTLDLDRVHIDAVMRELYRAREAAVGGLETWWTDGGTGKDA